MERKGLVVPEQQVVISRKDDLLPLLEGKVFHVTTSQGYEKILQTGALLPNTGEHRSPFGNSSNGYFRLKGCVSFFDYRRSGSPKWLEHYDKCLPTMPLNAASPIVVLYLNEDEHGLLETWEGWKTDQLWSQRVVPHVEVGYPGPVELSRTHGHLLVTLSAAGNEDPLTEIAAAYLLDSSR